MTYFDIAREQAEERWLAEEDENYSSPEYVPGFEGYPEETEARERAADACGCYQCRPYSTRYIEHVPKRERTVGWGDVAAFGTAIVIAALTAAIVALVTA